METWRLPLLQALGVSYGILGCKSRLYCCCYFCCREVLLLMLLLLQRGTAAALERICCMETWRLLLPQALGHKVLDIRV